MSDWYEEHIEAPIRPLVKLLRDNGFNTLGSCGHNMYVQLLFMPEWDIVTELSEFMIANEYKDFLISVEHRVSNGRSWTYVMLYLKENCLLQVYNPSAPGIIEMLGAQVEKQ